MLKRLIIYLQYLLPQHLFSIIAGQLANSRLPWLKNLLIQGFLKKYSVNLKEAENEDPYTYPSFNDFFTRHLKPSIRPLVEDITAIVSPVDGIVSQLGLILEQRLIQAKQLYFSLETLLGKNFSSHLSFKNGSYATFYLAPKDYHRVHMPLDGVLVKSIFIPGKLFSVNRMTSQVIPCLYGRNERLILMFDTIAGPVAIILIGALIVGSIQTVWENKPVRANKITVNTYDNKKVVLKKGEEMGHFKMGSTVILLFEKEKVDWVKSLKSGSSVLLREKIGNFHSMYSNMA